MKKVLICLISFLFVSAAFVSGAIFLSGCYDSSLSIENPSEDPNFDDDNENQEGETGDLVITKPIGKYFVSVSFNKNTTDTVSNMPRTASNSSDMISTNIDGYWNLRVTIGSSKPQRSGYKFVEWNTNSSGTGISYDPGDSVSVGGKTPATSASTTLYAIWAVANSYYLDVNSVSSNILSGTGFAGFTFNVYADGSLVGNNVQDFYQPIYEGSTVKFEVANIPSGYGLNIIEYPGGSTTNSSVSFTMPSYNCSIQPYINSYNIDNDLRNWTEYHGRYANYSNVTYNADNKMSTFTVTTNGVWEILAFPFFAPSTDVNKTYFLSFNYVVPNYSGLPDEGGNYTDLYNFKSAYDGLAVQIINDTGPADSSCTDRDYLTYRLPTSSKSGTVCTTFNNYAGNRINWILINGGFIADGQTLTFSIGNFRITEQATATSIDNDLRSWTEYVGYKNNYSNISYNEETKMSTFALTTNGVWEILAFPILAPSTDANREYYLLFDYVVPNYTGIADNAVDPPYSDKDQFRGYDGLAVQIINDTGPDNTHCTDRDYLTYRLPTSEGSGTVYAKFNNISATNTIWILINGGYINDNQTPTFSLGNFRIAERVYTITYDANGGSGDVPKQVVKAEGETVIIADNNLTKTGYMASGWNTLSSGTGLDYANGTSYSTDADLTLYAKWQIKEFYVDINILNPNGEQDFNSGTMTIFYSSTGQTFENATNEPSPSMVRYNETITISNITPANGYRLGSVGLTSSNGTLTSSNNTYTFQATTDGSHQTQWYNEIIIQMEYETYTITFNEREGTEVEDISYIITDTISLPGCDRVGYNFNSWKPERTSGSWSNGTTYASGTSLSGMYGDVTLVAQWTAYKYTVIFDKNSSNATGTMSNQTFTYDVSQNLTANAFENDGYSFVGWATSPTGNVIYLNGESVSNLTNVNNGQVTLYAKWTANLEAKKDEAGGYYYVEIGNMPQTKVTDSSLISQLNNATTNGGTYYINGTTIVGKVVIYNNQTIEACKYENNWYKVEPIRWRLAYSSSQKSGYGTTTDTFAVLDTIVYAGQYSATEIGLNSGYVTTTLDEFKKNITSTTYLATFSANVESFSPTGTTSSSQSANVFISSADEISSVLNNKSGSAKYSVKFSDLVSDILGNGIKQYYTRNLGSNISTIKSYTELGMPTQNLCTNLQGVQFTIKVSEYGCVWFCKFLLELMKKDSDKIISLSFYLL